MNKIILYQKCKLSRHSVFYLALLYMRKKREERDTGILIEGCGTILTRTATPSLPSPSSWDPPRPSSIEAPVEYSM